jgi:hypothetical protein
VLTTFHVLTRLLPANHLLVAFGFVSIQIRFRFTYLRLDPAVPPHSGGHLAASFVAGSTLAIRSGPSIA